MRQFYSLIRLFSKKFLELYEENKQFLSLAVLSVKLSIFDSIFE